MKYILTLETEDINDLPRHLNAHKYQYVVAELLSQVRTAIKHTDQESIAFEELREKITQLLDDQGLSTDDVFL